LFAFSKPLETRGDTIEDTFFKDNLHLLGIDELRKTFMHKDGRNKYPQINWVDQGDWKPQYPLYTVDSSPLTNDFVGDHERIFDGPLRIVLSDFGCGMFYRLVSLIEPIIDTI
jgi:hypothetical protein